MTQLSHDLEGIADGTTLTQGSGGNTATGSNNYFNGIDIATGGVCQAAAAAAYAGTSGLRLAVRGTAGLTDVNWDASFGTAGDFYNRCFFRLSVQPATIGNNPDVVLFRPSGGAGRQGSIVLTTVAGPTSKWEIDNGSGSLAVSGTTALTVGSWYRLETFVHSNATTGYITARLYADPTAAIANFTEELNAGGSTTWAMSNALTGFIGHQISGGITNYPTATGFLDFDNIVVGASAWVGPLPSLLPQSPHMYLARTAANF